MKLTPPLWTPYLLRAMILSALLVGGGGFNQVLAQVNQEETFGKNRVQYHRAFQYWWQYETENFITYWYGSNRTMAEVAVFIAEKNYEEIQRLLEHSTNEKIELIVFRDLTDLKQSNLGTEEIFELQRGETKVIRNKVFVYFDGDQNNLEQQIRSGIANVLAQFMLQGSAVQEFVRSTFFNALPDWFIPGLVAYLSNPEDIRMMQRREAYFLEDRKRHDFEDLTSYDATLAGYSMWDYIYMHYGPMSLTNLLYISRINKDMNNAFVYALNTPVAEVQEDCMAYHKQHRVQWPDLDPQEVEFSIPIRRMTRSKRAGVGYEMTVSDVDISPSGGAVAYVTNEIGRYKVWVHQEGQSKQVKLIQGGFRNPFQTADLDYPLIRFLNENELIIIEERRDVLYLQLHDLLSGEVVTQKMAPGIDRVYALDAMSADTLVLSAVEDEYVDLYLYMPRTRQYTKLTDDYYDDLDARVVHVGSRPYIAFSSNRPSAQSMAKSFDTIMVQPTRDIYLLSMTNGIMQQITNTPDINEWNLTQDGDDLYYLSDRYGSAMRWHLNLKSEELTPALYSLRRHDIVEHAIAGDRMVEYAEAIDGEPRMAVFDKSPHRTALSWKKVEKAPRKPPQPEVTVPLQPAPQAQENITFQTPFDDEIPAPELSESSVGQGDDNLVDPFVLQPLVRNITRRGSAPEAFNSSRSLAYRLRFGLNDFDLDMNNDLLFTGLNSFAGFRQGFEFPDPGILMRAELRDLFENYVVSGGMRIPLTFDGTEFFLSVSDRRKRLDKTLSLYRSGQRERNDIRFTDRPDTRNTTHMGVFELSYPFSIFSALRLSTTLRQDRTNFLPESPADLDRDPIIQQRIGLQLAYVYDNSYENIPNIRQGFRGKIYTEVMNRFRIQLNPGVFEPNEAVLSVIGLDVRRYLRLDRLSILALRGAGAASFGSEKILYYMGGTRNWLSTDFNTTTPVPNDNFAFQAPAVDVRGFNQNIRNGTNYILGNVELRVPLFHYFTKRRIRSNFFRGFQLVGFVDGGSAWHGTSPWDDENPLNTENLNNAVSNVTVRYFRDPFVLGYGAGARLTILGYFIRLDYAWGFETRRTSDPVFYFSLGQDF